MRPLIAEFRAKPWGLRAAVLTEREIFDQLRNQLKVAAEACDHIAGRPESGIHFMRLRSALKLAEGCCRQAAYWRSDTRWLQPGIKLEQAHQRARAWLHRPTIEAKKLFVMLAAAVRRMALDLAILETAATGRTGTILPKPKRYDRENRAIQIPAAYHLPRMSAGGIIISDGRA